MSLPPIITATLLAQSNGAPPNAYAYLADDFVGDDDQQATERGWSLYKPDAVSTAEITDNQLRLEPVRGGDDPTASLWFTMNAATEYDGFLVYKAIGPASGTPVSFDARARLMAMNSAQDNDPPVGVGQYRYVVLAVHDPDRSLVYNYLHIGIGADPDGLQVEVKTTDNDGATGQSVFPVEAASGSGSGLAYDVRIVRRASDPQRFDTYYRATGAEPLTSDVGWIAHTPIDRTDDSVPARDVAVPLPDDLQIGLSVYANPTTHDVYGRALGFVVLPAAD